MAARLSLDELLRGMPPEKLDHPCTDDHLSEIALSLTDWQSMAPFLGLNEVDERVIICCYPNQLVAQNIALLRKWRQKFGEGATYKELAKAFYRLGKLGLIERICSTLNSSSETTISPFPYQHENGMNTTDLPRTVVVKYTDHCRTFFHRLWKKIRRTRNSQCEQSQSTLLELPTHTTSDSNFSFYTEYLRGRYQTQIPSFLTLQWPPPPTLHVFNLAMIQGQNIRYDPVDENMVRLMLHGRVTDILYQKTPVQLKDIFQMDKARRKVILIEGAPGSGKSTLAWYVCQRWESGKLFQDFQAVVFVQLRDPAIQSARSVEDILPAESRRQAARVVGEFQGCHGRGILWVMDGWDELPSTLRTDSVFYKLITSPEKLNLHFSTVLITSRPIASGDLYRVISSRLEILGFTPTEVQGYFTEAVGGDFQTVQKLQDQLRERPVIEASCYLPLNAAIVTHLFLTQNHSLPTTLHGIFTSLVLCCLIRHVTKEGKDFGDISSLDNLPPCLQTPLQNICFLAYDGIKEDKVTFSEKDLVQKISTSQELATLGLIQGVKSFASFKKSLSFNFLHLSVQELLASFYISKLPPSEQVQVFNFLFGQPRFAAVFQFYAAFTKLETKGIREIIASIVKEKEKPHLLYLLNGLFEAQDLSLCQFVGSQLGGELDLSHTTLSPVDCLSASYFISCICLTTSGEIKVNLKRCSLDAYKVSFLVKELSNCCSCSTTHGTAAADTGVPGCIDLNLSSNSLHGNGTRCIAELIGHSTVISKLSLYQNKIQEDEDGLYNLSQALRINSSLIELNLSGCGITAKGIEVLSDALSINKHLATLVIDFNEFGDSGLDSLCNNLISTLLKTLSMKNCGITEKGVKVLVQSLLTPMNGPLEVLDVGGNAISNTGVARIAVSLEQNNSLKSLKVGKCCITEKGAEYLADSLRSNQFLENLDLYDNHIADAGIDAIAKALKQSSNFKALNVALCGITEKGAESFADCLMVNHSLEVLNLLGNHILDTGVTLIANALAHNFALKELLLSKGRLTDQCMGPLAHALEVNSSLEMLDLGFNQFTDTVLAVLGESLVKNRGLQILVLCQLEKVSDEGLKQLLLNLQENCILTELIVGRTGGESKAEVEVLNRRRRQKGITELKITSSF